VGQRRQGPANCPLRMSVTRKPRRPRPPVPGDQSILSTARISFASAPRQPCCCRSFAAAAVAQAQFEPPRGRDGGCSAEWRERRVQEYRRMRRAHLRQATKSPLFLQIIASTHNLFARDRVALGHLRDRAPSCHRHDQSKFSSSSAPPNVQTPVYSPRIAQPPPKTRR